MFNKLEERLIMLKQRHIKSQIKFLQMNTKMTELKNPLNEFNTSRGRS